MRVAIHGWAAEPGTWIVSNSRTGTEAAIAATKEGPPKTEAPCHTVALVYMALRTPGIAVEGAPAL